MMQTFVRPSRDLRNHYAEISEMLKDHDHVIITNHGRGESVLINIEDYAKYEEFMHQRYVAEALAKAKQQAADPDTQWADHESVWETLGKQYDVYDQISSPCCAGLERHCPVSVGLLPENGQPRTERAARKDHKIRRYSENVRALPP